MIILGIDPGMTRLGLGAVKIEGGNLSLLTYGMIAHSRDPNLTFNKHLNKGIHQITTDFPRVLDVIQPDLICAEIVPVGRLGSNTELVVSAITTCKVISFQFGFDWKDLGANTIKKQVTGDGKANKTLVRNTVLAAFPTVEAKHKELKEEQKVAGEKREGLPQDVFDALASAIAGAKIHGIDEGSAAPSAA